MLALSLALTCYILPKDGAQAHTDFLALLHSPGETWIADYGFTESDVVAEILKADGEGIVVHLLLDRSQFGGTTEHPIVTQLIANLKRGDVTITTAGPLSPAPDAIMHSKVMVVDDPSGGEPFCWVGSVNFSVSGWEQANVAMRFRSKDFAAAFIDFFDVTKEWARQHVPQPTPTKSQGAIA